MLPWLKSFLSDLSITGIIEKIPLGAIAIWLVKKFGDYGFDFGKQWIANWRGRFLVGFRDFYYSQEIERHDHDYAQRFASNGTGKPLESVEQIEAWVRSDPSPFLVLSGVGSIGKSRCCIEAAKHRNIKWISLRNYLSNADKLENGLTDVVRKGSVCVYEDYQEYGPETFKKVVGVIWRKKAKLLAVSTDESGPRKAITAGQRGPVKYIQLGTLAEESIRQIAANRAAFKKIQLDDESLRNVVQISNGRPGIAILALDLYAEVGTLQGVHNTDELLASIYKRYEDQFGDNWNELKQQLAKLALIRTGPFLEAEHVRKNGGVNLQGGTNGTFRNFSLASSIFNDYFAKRCYFENGLAPEFAVTLDEFLTTKAQQILTTIINCDNIEAAAVLLTRAKKLDAKTVLDLGIQAFEGFKDIDLVQSNIGEFWDQVWKLSDPDDYHKTALLLVSLGKYDEAEKCWNRALVLCRERENFWGEGITYNNLGSMHLQRNDWDRAVQCQTRALESFRRTQPDFVEWAPFGLAQTYNQLALIFKTKGNLEGAIQNLELSLDEFSKLKGDYGGLSRAEACLILGYVFHDVGDWNQAMDYYDAACKIFERLQVPSRLAACYSALSTAFADRRDWESADKFFQEAMRTLAGVGDLRGIAQIYSNFGSLYFRKSDWENSESFYREAQRLYKQLDDQKGIAEALTGLAWIHQGRGEWNQAIESLEAAGKIYTNLGNTNGTAQIQAGLASVYLGRADWDQALELYHQALQSFEKLGARNQAGLIRLNIGWVHGQKGDYQRAGELYEQAKNIFEELGNQLGMSNAYIRLGTINQQLGKLDTALALYEQGRQIAERMSNVRDILNAEVAIASVYHNMGRWDEAIAVYASALKLYRELGDKFGVVHVQMNIGSVYGGKGEWDKAIQCYQEAFEISESLQNTHDKAAAQSGLAAMAQKRGDWDRAAQIYESALDVFTKLGDLPGKAARHDDLAFIFSRKGDWNRAIRHWEESKSLYGEIADPHGMASTWLMRGLIHNEMGEHLDAVRSYEQALKLYEQLEARSGMAAAYNNMGLAFQKLGKSEDAVRVLKLSMELSTSSGDRQLTSYSLTILGMVNSDLCEWELAERNYQQGLQMKRELNDTYGIAWSEGEIGMMYMRKAELEKAEELLLSSLRSFGFCL